MRKRKSFTRYFAQVGKSEVARAQIESLEKALDHYRLDVLMAKPANEAGLQVGLR